MLQLQCFVLTSICRVLISGNHFEYMYESYTQHTPLFYF